MTVKRPAASRNLPDVVIITGLSGSGMSSATNAFEDLSYFCVDNLPVTLLPTFARLLTGDEKTAIERAALVINIRERQFLTEFPAQLDNLRAQGLKVFVLFLEAAEEVLLRRFSETRRPHPADDGSSGLQPAIAAERGAMRSVRELADLIIDTSEHTVHTLRRLLIERFNPQGSELPLRVQILSFGHKYGAPRDLDLLFDVRHLPNPYFVAELRHFSGGHPKIIKYLREQSVVNETNKRFLDLLNYLLPFYKKEGKAYLSVGIGCTGGRHRSVMVANTLGRELRRAGYDVQITHRDVKKAVKKIG